MSQTELTRKRGAIKAKQTGFKKFLDALQTKHDAAETITEIEIIELSKRIELFLPLIKQFDTTQTKLEETTDNIEQQYEERGEFEETYYELYAKSNFLLSKLKPIEESVKPVESSTTQHINLPKIDLPKFSGSYNNWLEYRDTYESIIHKNTRINDIDKFHYLKSSLSGEAAQVIKAIELSEVNYKIAWEILCSRYNNTRLLVYNHVKALFNLDPITKESSIKLRNLMDNVAKHLRALEAMNQPINSWDTLVIHLITLKLDTVTLREWETHKVSKELPSLKELTQFLNRRADILETLDANVQEKRFAKSREQGPVKTFLSVKFKCPVCEGDHYIQNCKKFLTSSVQNRKKAVEKAKLCSNCLRRGHQENVCISGSCKKCSKRHNTNLHEDTKDDETKQNIAAFSCTIQTETQILLSTVCIEIYDHEKKLQTARAILDSGSQSSFISKQLIDKLRLPISKINLTMAGLNNSLSHIKGKCDILLKANKGNFETKIQCLVIPDITGNFPNKLIKKSSLKLPENIQLADPQYYKPGKVDLLLGADCFWSLIGSQQHKMGRDLPVLQETKLGWIISGPLKETATNMIHCNLAITQDVQQQLSRFWEIEEITNEHVTQTEEEKASEQHFVTTTKRNEEGRFIVSLPLKESRETLGTSLEQAKKRFYSLERQLERNEELGKRYKEFMNEYESMNHMTKLGSHELNDTTTYYLPHHCVLRDESLTTKLRVVFDASAKSTSGKSLNDIQMIGPTIQEELLDILIRFRKHKYVISADISKMYRQILVADEDRPLQRIVWRSNPSEPLQFYNLNTVTYGTSAAPFQATRCLQQLAVECEKENPTVSEIIKKDFYMDDLLSGATTRDEASQICKEISRILKSGGFELRKFCSNDPSIIEDGNLTNDEFHIIKLGDENTKTLGLTWNPKHDKLMYTIKEQNEFQTTKRTMLSCIAQIFDPLGLLSPCVITVKIMIQALWLENLQWDDEVPDYIKLKFLEFKRVLPHLNTLKITRYIFSENHNRVEMHCFADASEQAYGGCIYIRTIEKHGEIHCHLLCAKSKVAPLKLTSIPRLELCGALTTTKLAKRAIKALDVKLDSVNYWTDSSTVLRWLKLPARALKTFVSHRINEIQEMTNGIEWRHIATKENPADLITRGYTPMKLIEDEKWWYGPSWLSREEKQWPESKLNMNSELPEKRKTIFVFFTRIESILQFERYSTLTKIKRVMSYMIRFINNCKKKKLSGQISLNELNYATLTLIKFAQAESFQTEFKQLAADKLDNGSRLLGLNPFFDEMGILRVGGRLENSSFDYEKKHPPILDSKHHFTKLIFRDVHERLHHAPPQLLLATVRQNFWPIAGKNLAKKTVRTCMRCFRFNPAAMQPIMGNLPENRITPEPPFNVSGVDYAGPFFIKDRKGRGCKITKAYVCLFVCFVTKAIHLELATSLNKEAFLMALRRFTARRGKPRKIHSDNGTNFVAANNELKELGQFLKENDRELQDQFINENIEWEFNPPYTPHFGGLWEAGVKSVKHHLKRVLGSNYFTYEELYTVLVQVEGILNSRPLSPLSTDPQDLLPLTPAHFLIGRPLTDIPDNDYTEIPTNRLAIHHHLQKLTQDIWNRWSVEYVSELQQRTKWKKNQGNLDLGALVLIKEDHQPPLKWRLGRVLEIRQGKDKVARIATLRTQQGIIQRGINRICPLPCEELNEKDP